MANIAKTSICFFNKQRVRARWDDESLNWWYAAVDLIGALVDTKDARKYWYAFKKRHIELSTFCRQLKMTASDGKAYNVDCLDQSGINTLLTMLPTKVKVQFSDWIKGLMDPVDEQSPTNAQAIFGLISNALTDKITDREIFMKGIDYSYYYETIED